MMDQSRFSGKQWSTVMISLIREKITTLLNIFLKKKKPLIKKKKRSFECSIQIFSSMRWSKLSIVCQRYSVELSGKENFKGFYEFCRFINEISTHIASKYLEYCSIVFKSSIQPFFHDFFKETNSCKLLIKESLSSSLSFVRKVLFKIIIVIIIIIGAGRDISPAHICCLYTHRMVKKKVQNTKELWKIKLKR